MKAIRSLFALALVLPLLPAAGRRAAGPADEIIAKARAYLGREDVLNSVRTVHYIGSFEDDTHQKVGLDVVFVRPYRQLMVVTTPKTASAPGVREITVLDGYAGWREVQEIGGTGRGQITMLDVAPVKRLRANVWENLYFYRDIGKKGGHVDYLGPASVDGHAAIKVAFVHDNGIVFTRYFDAQTGQRLLSETESGGSIREEGEIIAGGLHFPKKLTNVQNGKTVVITFDEVRVNESVPESVFALPGFYGN